MNMHSLKISNSVGRDVADGMGSDLTHVVLLLCKSISLTFCQSYYPLLAVFVLINFTYLNMLSWQFRLAVLAEVFLSTVVIPQLGGRLYDHFARRWHFGGVRQRAQVHNFLAYVGSMLCIHLLQGFHMPYFVQSYLWVTIAYQVVCMIVGGFWRISTQSAAAGSVVGALTIYSLAMDYNAMWWICLSVLVCGMVNTSRLLLRRNTRAQVFAGTWVGVLCGIMVIALM